MRKHHAITLIALFALTTLACGNIRMFAETPVGGVDPTQAAEPSVTATSLPSAPVQPGASNPGEPVAVTGTIPFTWPFFLEFLTEPFVMLEDEAGFVNRDKEFEFTPESQNIGPVELIDENTLGYVLSLPAVPQGTSVDVDNDGGADTGVQIFAVALWSNTWGDAFVEERDGTGWSTAYSSTLVDAENENEITGGTLIVWSPDDAQQFPTGFGEDGLLFTEDDPVAPIAPGYNIVNLDQDPFEVTKEARPQITLYEGDDLAVNDYSTMSYAEAFDAFFEKASREYPFTDDKNVDWQALYDEYAPQIADANSDAEFYRALRGFVLSIPDSHIGLTLNPDVFIEDRGGGFGMILAELSDGRVLVTKVYPDTAAANAGIEAGAEILEWDGAPIASAIAGSDPLIFSSYSTDHTRRQGELLYLTRVPLGTRVAVSFQNPGGDPEEEDLVAEQEFDSWFDVLVPPASFLSVPVEAKVLDSGLGYIKINSFADDTRLTAQLWERYIEQMNENQIPGLIIDLRSNGGGSGGLALAFAGYFFDEEITVTQDAYYNDETGEFEYEPEPGKIEPGPIVYEGPIAVLVGPDCVSACEYFAYYLTVNERATIVGSFPTAGAAGEVGRGQYTFPGEIDLQIPTGRPETPDGDLLIEGVGVVPDILVPVTDDMVMGREDEVLKAAEEALLERVR